MGNRNTATFQSLKDLPIPLHQSPCVPHKHEILICGGAHKRACYSYHTIKNEYKFICEYPSDVYLYGHCVVKLIDNKNKNSDQITLLSFGSDWIGEDRHTLMMKYVSVWKNDNNDYEMNIANNCNQWIPFIDNDNHPIIIGRDKDKYWGARAVIGGSNNHLLFITYSYGNISVFDLNTFQFIKHDNFPTDNNIYYHCFVQGQEIIKTNEEKNKQNHQMLLFDRKIGLSIEYDEDNNTFQFHKLSVCSDITSFNGYGYGYVCINDVILFFGGCHSSTCSKSVYMYSIQEDKWTKFKKTLPSPLYNCVAILSEEENYIHIIGGQHNSYSEVSTHTKTKVRVWYASQLVIICLFICLTQINFFPKDKIKFIIQYWIRTLNIKLGWIDNFDQIIFKYSGMR
ncbi:hypothetical protein RFI_12311 [Reticulomyxa filosa]|uniref:Kelch motif family protein n=1 Tax=Reticulomyxa filosa TaxID=46433 RepID=X6NEU1_RETFI|nr:hypothetical protein RFI_12311 [Reticulomyxa filosa]|eukprot:ETO24845.1 hypothetical protein RFI_12311 [Reticulomyxa filosa]